MFLWFCLNPLVDGLPERSSKKRYVGIQTPLMVPHTASSFRAADQPGLFKLSRPAVKNPEKGIPVPWHKIIIQEVPRNNH